MTLVRNSVVRKAVHEGVLHRGMLKICKYTKRLDNEIVVSPAGGFVEFLKGMDMIKTEYLKKGLVKQDRAPFLYNEGLIDKNSTLLLARKDQQVIGTIGVIHGENKPLPCQEIFNGELKALDLGQRKIMEIGALSVKSDAETENLVFLLYLKTMIYAIFIDRVDDIFIQVMEKKAAFYIRNLLFQQVGCVKPHPGYSHVNACLLRVDVKALKEKIYERQCYGRRGWAKILYELGLLTECKKVFNQSRCSKKFTLDKKEAEVYHYLCHL